MTKPRKPGRPKTDDPRTMRVKMSGAEWAHCVSEAGAWGVCRKCKGSVPPESATCCGAIPRPMRTAEWVRMRCGV